LQEHDPVIESFDCFTPVVARVASWLSIGRRTPNRRRASFTRKKRRMKDLALLALIVGR
jgi:hypothetical protein